MKALLLSAMNLGILIGILVYFLRKPLAQFVSDRKRTVSHELVEVEALLKMAREKYEEYSSKLKAVEVEINTIERRTQEEALQTKQRIINHSKQLAQTIVADSRAFAAERFNELKIQIVSDFGNKVVDRAEGLISKQLTQSDRERFRKEFSNQVGVVR